VNLTLSNRKLLCFFVTSFNWAYLCFRNRAGNTGIEMFNIYAIQLVVKVTVNAITADKLSRRYNDLYLGVTFWDTEY